MVEVLYVIYKEKSQTLNREFFDASIDAFGYIFCSWSQEIKQSYTASQKWIVLENKE